MKSHIFQEAVNDISILFEKVFTANWYVQDIYFSKCKDFHVRTTSMQLFSNIYWLLWLL